MAMGLIVGGWFASTVISKLINELIDYAKDQKKMQLGLKDELARLEKALPKIQAVVNAVDQGLIREKNPALEKWLWQLRDVADQADDVMDEIKYNYVKERALKAEKNKVVDKAITNFKTFFLREVEKDSFLNSLVKAVKAIDEVVADVIEFYMLVRDLNKDQKEMVKSAISSRQTSSVLNVGTHVFGRENVKEDIIKKLLNPVCKIEGNNFAVLPIIGVGGVGKTTLTQLVYHDPTVIQQFELRMWVCISNNFDVESLTKKLYEAVFKKRAGFESFDLMQTKLTEKLKSQRFLVVFDDAWNDSDKLGWEKLVAPLKHGKSGSMILLTTRLKTVAKMVGPNVMDSINLESLNECDMWNLFKECAFGDQDPDYHKELVEIGRDIVKKLKGSPLAAKTVGAILCSDINEVHWRNILEDELWSLEQKTHNDIMPGLRLTYQYLSPHLKPCFLFCSIFPQDHVFLKHDLINMWIALGMVLPSVNSTMRPEDVGSNYFDDLVSISIFICFKGDEFVMHDLIHDLSIFVSQGECLRTSTNKMESIPNTVRHLYVHIDSSHELSISGLRNLRALILNFDSHDQPDLLVTEMLKGMENLRLLILFVDNLSAIPECVNKLLHLRYLNIRSSRINAVPKSMSRLYLLETMVYKYKGLFLCQPKQVNTWGRLINLRHLTAPWQWLDNTAGIGRLTSLQELDFSVGKDDVFKICELRDMRDLRRLTINRIENVCSCEEVEQANLKEKIFLNKLSLEWRSPRKPHLDEDVLDHLEPHHALKELRIINYKGTGRPPIWFTTRALSKLVRLIIYGCTFVDLPCLEELPLLKYIDFSFVNALKEIIHECNLSSAVDAFPSLEELSFNGMNELKEWCLAKQPNKWMQRLRKLYVCNCPKLQVLPPIPVGVKELSFGALGLNALPNFWNDQSCKSGSLSDLIDMSIRECENVVSLNEGLLQSPERIVNLEKLKIHQCPELMNLPPGGFNKFISLKALYITACPKIVVQEECFLPSALQKLSISSCGHFETFLPKALENVHSLTELDLRECANITSLPPKEVFSRWKTLKRLKFGNCPVLASLESLVGLSSIEHLRVYGCPKLSQAIAYPLPLKKDETSDRNDEFNNWFSACSRKALTFFQILLCTLFYFVLRMFMPKLKRSVSSQPQLPCPSTQEKTLLSVDEIVIDDPLLLSIEPIRSLSVVNKLTISDCSKLQSLPKLPLILQELCILCCSLDLQMRCKELGSDWPKLSQIPVVIVK